MGDVQIPQAAHRVIHAVNSGVSALVTSPRWGRFVGRQLTTIGYVGRRSARDIQLPVAYRRRGAEIVIPVGMPDAKKWWRNFTGEGAPLTILLDGVNRTGHAVADRDAKGRVTVIVRLDP